MPARSVQGRPVQNTGRSRAPLANWESEFGGDPSQCLTFAPGHLQSFQVSCYSTRPWPSHRTQSRAEKRIWFCQTFTRRDSLGMPFDGHTLLTYGLIIVVLGLFFGLVIYRELKHLRCIARCWKCPS